MSTHTINGVAKKGWVEQHTERKRAAERADHLKMKRDGPRIEVVEDSTGECIAVVQLSDLHGRTHAEKVEEGMNINLDHERFSTRIVDVS